MSNEGFADMDDMCEFGVQHRAWLTLLDRIARDKVQREHEALIEADRKARARRFTGDTPTGFGDSL